MRLDKAIEHFGSKAALARAVGVSKQALWKWEKNGNRVPLGRAYQLEVITDGALKAEEGASNDSPDAAA